MSKDIFSLSEADIKKIIETIGEIPNSVQFSDIEGLFTPNFLSQIENLIEHKSSFEEKIYQNLDLAGDSEFFDVTEYDYEKLRLENETHLLNNLVPNYKNNIVPQKPHKLWDKEGSLTMSLSNHNEMRNRKEASLFLEIAYKL